MSKFWKKNPPRLLEKILSVQVLLVATPRVVVTRSYMLSWPAWLQLPLALYHSRLRPTLCLQWRLPCHTRGCQHCCPRQILQHRRNQLLGSINRWQPGPQHCRSWHQVFQHQWWDLSQGAIRPARRWLQAGPWEDQRVLPQRGEERALRQRCQSWSALCLQGQLQLHQVMSNLSALKN